jgi:nuclear transport factor 2 (NTF2) superfamily protein
MSRPPLPPFDTASAITKVRAAEDAWNGRDPARVALAYTQGTRWRNRSELLVGREVVERFLARKWEREREYRLVKELWTFTGARISVRFAYEWVDAEGRWTRSYGNEQWEFDESGLMRPVLLRAVRRALGGSGAPGPRVARSSKTPPRSRSRGLLRKPRREASPPYLDRFALRLSGLTELGL